MARRPIVVVRKLRDDGSEAYRWSGRLLERSRDGVIIVARFNGPPGSRIGDVALAPSDIFVEFYYFDRWYNVNQVYSSAGELKGWYGNVATPAEWRDAQLTYTDLVLDVFVPPSGEPQVLDLPEFEQRAHHLAPARVQGARRGLAALLELAERRALPSRPFADSAAVLGSGAS